MQPATMQVPVPPAPGRRPRMRRKLAARDGATCVWCHVELDPEDGQTATVEHLMPASSGGRLVMCNAVLACQPCNLRRGNRDVIEFARVLYAEGAEPNWETLRAALLGLRESDLPGWRGERHRIHAGNQHYQVKLLSTRRERKARKKANKAKRKAKRERRAAARAAASS